MNLDPALGRFDRLANLAGGMGILAYSFLGDFDHMWVRLAIAVGGGVAVVGGIGGT